MVLYTTHSCCLFWGNTFFLSMLFSLDEALIKKVFQPSSENWLPNLHFSCFLQSFFFCLSPAQDTRHTYKISLSFFESILPSLSPVWRRDVLADSQLSSRRRKWSADVPSALHTSSWKGGCPGVPRFLDGTNKHIGEADILILKGPPST